MKKLMFAFAACAVGVLFAAEVGDTFTLQTKSTTMALQKQRGAWNLLHYGAKVANGADAGALAPNVRDNPSFMATRRAAAYSVYGDKAVDKGINKCGGLQVTHADGCLTTYLEGVKAETVEDKPGVTHLVLTQKDAVYPFYVIQHFRAFAACDVIEPWVALRHEEKGAVRLGRMDSLAFDFPLLANQF